MFETDHQEIGYSLDCKWHKIPCQKEGDCKKVSILISYWGEFYHASLTLPIQKLFKKETLEVTGIGDSKENSIDNLISKLNSEQIAA